MTDERKPTYFCDTHCHLDMSAFSEDLGAVLQRAVDAGLEFVVIPALDCATAKNALELARQKPDFFYVTVGIHPNNAAEVEPGCLSELASLAVQPGVVAIGEIGLDYFRQLNMKKSTWELSFLSCAPLKPSPVEIHLGYHKLLLKCKHGILKNYRQPTGQVFS